MARGVDNPQLRERLGVPSFEQRWPWIGGDLQTLRDTLREVDLPHDQGVPIEIPVPALPSGAAAAGSLLALLDLPEGDPKGLVLLLHGLGGSSSREGLRRMGVALQAAGFAVLRLNLRGADPGRHLAGGTYAARCNSDLLPVIARARSLAAGRPLLGAGISLGGTMLLNAALASPGVLDGLFCASSPLDLAACSASIERPRNRVYQRWLLKRLVRQTLAAGGLLMWRPTTARLHPCSIWCPPVKRCRPPCCCRPWMILGFLLPLQWISQRRCLRRLRFAPCSRHGEGTTASMAATDAGAISWRRPGSGTLLLVKP